jgi:putative transposase
MCRVLSVSRSGYYAWKSRPKSARSESDTALLALIRSVHAESRGCYGSPRIYRELQRKNVKCGRAHVARLMRKLHLRGIAARRRKPRLPQVDRSALPNHLHRDFSVGEIDRAWAADMTYIRTAEGWLFLAVVLDIGSRRVIGWAMSARPDTDVVLRALEMAVARRQVQAGVVHHSDRGVHYTNSRYRQMLQTYGLTASYSRLGNCWDNAVVESFFHTLKTEEVCGARYTTRREAKKGLFEFIEVWYNRKRRHSSLGHLSPVEFENRL